MNEEAIKRKPGRPVTALQPESLAVESSQSPKKVGHFIVINTPTLKGIRLNLEKVRTYAKAGQNESVIQVAWDNGTSSAYQFGSEDDAYKFLALLDEHCL